MTSEDVLIISQILTGIAHILGRYFQTFNGQQLREELFQWRVEKGYSMEILILALKYLSFFEKFSILKDVFAQEWFLARDLNEIEQHYMRISYNILHNEYKDFFQ